MTKPTEGRGVLDGVEVTRKELDERIIYCDYMSQVEIDGCPNKWSDIFAATSFWLVSQYQEQWDGDGLMFVEENDYHVVMDGHLEDYGFQDIYENGYKSSYSWMLGSRSMNPGDFDQDMITYSEEMGLPFPSWLNEEDYTD
jgi:hypothetical protein